MPFATRTVFAKKETPSSAAKVTANPNSRQAVGQAKQSALNCTVWQQSNN